MIRRPLRLAAALALALCAAAQAQTPETRLGETVTKLEAELGARVGVLIRDAASDWRWGRRAEERFPMNSTFKPLLCAAALAQADAGALSLDERLPVARGDILAHAPVTRARVGGTMAVGDLCRAALDVSDNTAANLVLARIGGPQAVTAFLRGMGDEVTRLDRPEPEVNDHVPGDPRDTTTPEAMLATWRALLLGDVLSAGSRARLAEWMSHGGVTAALLRDDAPPDWRVLDKSGGGRERTRSLVAMATPRDRAPYLIAIYIADADADWTARSAAVTEIAAAAIALIEARGAP